MPERELCRSQRDNYPKQSRINSLRQQPYRIRELAVILMYKGEETW
jgi:hypothetical protein